MKEKMLEGHKFTTIYCKTCGERPLRIRRGE
jgi:uncharacterized Zn finger protein (UPF0148 family)